MLSSMCMKPLNGASPDFQQGSGTPDSHGRFKPRGSFETSSRSCALPGLSVFARAASSEGLQLTASLLECEVYAQRTCCARDDDSHGRTRPPLAALISVRCFRKQHRERRQTNVCGCDAEERDCDAEGVRWSALPSVNEDRADFFPACDAEPDETEACDFFSLAQTEMP